MNEIVENIVDQIVQNPDLNQYTAEQLADEVMRGIRVKHSDIVKYIAVMRGEEKGIGDDNPNTP